MLYPIPMKAAGYRHIRIGRLCNSKRWREREHHSNKSIICEGTWMVWYRHRRVIFNRLAFAFTLAFELRKLSSEFQYIAVQLSVSVCVVQPSNNFAYLAYLATFSTSPISSFSTSPNSPSRLCLPARLSRLGLQDRQSRNRRRRIGRSRYMP